ncbi:MAG: hypothetical protein DMF87_10855 [Acidobacteria bacterium]|nr:MAG: hypothetical protein DMF87_10855 [Acidobacteriota bacterium]
MERRRALRRFVGAGEPLATARLRTGGQLRILDASSWGALAETTERLLPGRHLDVHIVSAQGRMLVRSRVARAFVARLEADAIHYHAALSFDRALDVRADGYVMPAVLAAVETDRGTRYPLREFAGDIEFTERLSA